MKAPISSRQIFESKYLVMSFQLSLASFQIMAEDLGVFLTTCP